MKRISHVNYKYRQSCDIWWGVCHRSQPLPLKCLWWYDSAEVFFFFWMLEVDKDCKYYFKHFSKQLFKFVKPYIVEPSSYVPCMKSQEGCRLNVFSINFLQLISDQIVWFSAGCKNRIEKLYMRTSFMAIALWALRQYTIFLNQGKSIHFDIDSSDDVYEVLQLVTANPSRPLIPANQILLTVS